MPFVGLLLLLVGFMMVIPSGSSPGSAAGRQVRMGASVVSTPGYSRGDDAVRPRRRIVIGLALMAAGVILLIVAL